MKHSIWFAALTLVLIGCQKITVDFTYSPTAPKAGETITFTNASSAGETWQWDFGDNGKSTLKSPTKYYKKPGTYLVTLQVDSVRSRSCSHSVTVYDSIPTFVASADSIYHMTNVTFTANIFNPFSYTLSYQWTLPEDCELVSPTLTADSVVVYFKKFNVSPTVHLDIMQGTTLHSIDRTFTIHQTPAPAILFSLEDGSAWRQRLYNERIEQAYLTQDSTNLALLSKAQDTLVTYNGRTFRARTMQQEIGVSADHIAIDVMEQKWYFTNSTGLYVTSLTGTHTTLIDQQATGPLFVDQTYNRLYWAAPEGMYGMPLIKSPYNQFSTLPLLYNDCTPISRITLRLESD